MTAAEATYQSAQPSLKIGDQRQERLEAGLLRLEVREQISGLCRLEATFGNWGEQRGRVDYLHFGHTLELGQRLSLSMAGGLLFEGRVSALEASYPRGEAPTFTVLAEDRFQDLRMTRRTRSFEKLSDEDLVRRLASDHGLSADVALPGPVYRVLAQVNQSDLAFLRERARAAGAELWLSGSTLHVKARSDRGAPSLELTYPGRLQEFTVLADLAEQASRVVVGGWDVAGKRAISKEAGPALLQGELGRDRSGAAWLKQAFGERVQTLAHVQPLTADEAQVQANSTYQTLARRFVVGQGVADPDARLRVGTALTLKGLGPLFSGRYGVIQTVYRFDRLLGSRSEFTAERPGLGQLQ